MGARCSSRACGSSSSSPAAGAPPGGRHRSCCARCRSTAHASSPTSPGRRSWCSPGSPPIVLFVARPLPHRRRRRRRPDDHARPQPGAAVPRDGVGGAGSTPLTVMTLNMHYGGADPDAVVAAVRAHDVDVLATEEMTPEAVDALQRRRHRRPAPATTTSSRAATAIGQRRVEPLPADPRRTRRATSATRRSRRCSTTTAGRSSSSAVHPLSPYPANAAEWSRRDRSHRDVARRRRGPRPSSPATSTPPATTSSSATSSTPGSPTPPTQAGVGWQPTYPANRRRIPLLVTIDHVLVHGGIVATDVDRLDIPDTDHAGARRGADGPARGFGRRLR